MLFGPGMDVHSRIGGPFQSKPVGTNKVLSCGLFWPMLLSCRGGEYADCRNPIRGIFNREPRSPGAYHPGTRGHERP
jgi:hypothetical protein